MVLEKKDKEGGRKAVSLFIPGLSGQEEGLFFFALFVLSLLFSPFFFSLFFSLSLSLSLSRLRRQIRGRITQSADRRVRWGEVHSWLVCLSWFEGFWLLSKVGAGAKRRTAKDQIFQESKG